VGEVIVSDISDQLDFFLVQELSHSFLGTYSRVAAVFKSIFSFIRPLIFINLP
jgi:hypothetical protein